MASELPRQTDVVIIGAGPVGLTAGLLLDQWQVDNLVVEAKEAPDDHPQAHFISSRTMEIFRELGMEPAIRRAAPPLEEWRRYVYATDLVGLSCDPSSKEPSASLLGLDDHFPTGPDRRISPTWECHLSQPALTRLLREALVRRHSDRLLEGWRARVHEKRDALEVVLAPTGGGRARRIRCRYVICADGAHSRNREGLAIDRLRKTPPLQQLLNVHFVSPLLADLLRRSPLGMLYVVLSPHGLGVFVNHSLARGEFVLQRPYFPPLEKPEDFDRKTAAAMIDGLVGAPVEADVRNITSWQLEAWVAQRYQSRGGRAFLTGDAAHQILPAGGFGMNVGIADAHNLAWKLAWALGQKGSGTRETARALLATYETERRPAAEKAIAVSCENYEKTLAVAAALGLDQRAAGWLAKTVQRLPLDEALGRRLFRAGMRLGLAQIHLLGMSGPIGRYRRRRLRALFRRPRRTLPMRFPDLDLGVLCRRPKRPAGSAVPSETNGKPFCLSVIAAGERIPHFWLRPAGAVSRQRVSSLDLASIAARRHRRPVHLLLVYGLPPAIEKQLADRIARQGPPFDLVRIDDAGHPSGRADVVLDRQTDTRIVLPPAMLVRPDGYLAWVGDSEDPSDYPPTGDGRMPIPAARFIGP